MGIVVAATVLALSLSSSVHADEAPIYHAELLQEFDVPIAKQGVAVGRDYFYVVDKKDISKHVKATGELVSFWPGADVDNPLIHMDGLIEHQGKLWAAHSNYPESPMTSSIEVWDATTMQHVSTHSFGIHRGSLTWLDYDNGSWWAAFANYDKVQKGQGQPYGLTNNTQIVKFDKDFVVTESWTLPKTILDRMRPMSNSGGSWGPDGYLYITGHDHGEIYAMELPLAGSVLHHVATVMVPVMEGQGIAWDRSGETRNLWGINKQQRKVARIRMPEITAVRPQSIADPAKPTD